MAYKGLTLMALTLALVMALGSPMDINKGVERK